MTQPLITGGCLCGAVRFEARSAPAMAGYCFCADCRKASGSGFIPFMGFPTEVLTITGRAVQFASPSMRGTDSVRNSCPVCGGLVFGGIWGEDTEHTIYAGALDDPSVFQPSVALFCRDKPDWVQVPDGVKLFETMPGLGPV